MSSQVRTLHRSKKRRRTAASVGTRCHDGTAQCFVTTHKKDNTPKHENEKLGGQMRDSCRTFAAAICERPQAKSSRCHRRVTRMRGRKQERGAVRRAQTMGGGHRYVIPFLPAVRARTHNASGRVRSTNTMVSLPQLERGYLVRVMIGCWLLEGGRQAGRQAAGGVAFAANDARSETAITEMNSDVRRTYVRTRTRGTRRRAA